MTGSALVQMAVTFLILSLISFGGMVAVIPEMHHQLVEVQGWLDDAAFANLFAIAQVAPGPNTMVVSLIGWKLGGWLGLIVATLAYVGPTSVIALLAARVIERHQGSWQLRAITTGMVPVATGLLVAGGIVLARVADKDVKGVVFTVLGVVFVLLTERNPLWLMLGVAAVGIGWGLVG